MKTPLTTDIRVSPEIQSRYCFGMFCAARGLLGTAMELGVHRGEFTGHFLAGWPGKRYVAVDRYVATEDCNPVFGHFRSERSLDREIAHAQLYRFERRGVLEWCELDVIEALEKEPPGSLDVVYDDAGHRFWETLGECYAAWERLRPGGILAGHDFSYDLPPVMRAVRTFATSVNRPIWLVMDEGTQWSWYLEKPTAGETRCES